MQVRAKLKNFRMSAKKARLYADLVRGKNADEAKLQLKVTPGKMTEPLIKLIDSGIANGENNFGLDKSNLFIESIKIDEGTVMKRWRPRAHGRAYPIFKRSCHVELILNEREEGKGRKEVKKKEVKTISYEELKKMNQEAEKLLEKQSGKGKKDKKPGKDDSSKKAQEGKAGGGALSKMFRRKSI